MPQAKKSKKDVLGVDDGKANPAAKTKGTARRGAK